ncbi:MAG TPA: CoA-acylating methylmalonate-semialdehyde dehydrogenase [Planctomycetota bacterium]|nr:CoA-acylating methylmalonate-semialdehyde dehydrogenase [Planctomycetota bacterium]
MELLAHHIGGAWELPSTGRRQPVLNPATGQPIAEVPISGPAEIDRAVQAGARAYSDWRRTPAGDRIQPLFRLKSLLEADLNGIARTITEECGKTLAEAVGELRRGIENIEVACGIPLLMQGYNSEDIARGIDEIMIRQPLGVVGIISPFNFPAMIPLWFLPYAIACGNAVVFKPSEKTPRTAVRLVKLLEEAGLPPGVVNLVHGGRETVDALLDHPQVRAISFVGSSPVARHVYARAASAGKRVQCQGGAKNPVIVLPDADFEMTGAIVADSAFGCAGQRCLATSLAITVGDARKPFTDLMASAARTRKVGSGLADGIQMGPVISAESRTRIEGMIETGTREGASLLVDGRNQRIEGLEGGYFVRPTVLDGVPAGGTIAKTEIFGPVLGLLHVRTIEEAIDLVNRADFGNQACLFTRSGAAARKFRYEAQVGNVGINLGVAAPIAMFPFSGWKGSFFGDLHGQGRDGVEFYTDKKVVIERWPPDWSRTF